MSDVKITLFVLLGVALIILHGTYTNFVVDYITVIIYAILSVPVLFEYLERLDLPGGTRFVFREKLKNFQNYYENNKEILERILDERTKKIIKEKKDYYRTFDFSIAKNLVNNDPSLAMASIRMEIENKLRLAHSILIGNDSKTMPLRKIIEELRDNDFVVEVQMNLLLKIVSICNPVIHGTKITIDEAENVLKIAEELNRTFSIGYSICFEYNKNFKKHGLVCPWEHCIEHMPLKEKRNKKSCPIFGHECPGGEKQVEYCKQD